MTRFLSAFGMVSGLLATNVACENRLFVDSPEAEAVDLATAKLTVDGLYWVQYVPQPAPIPYNDYFEINLIVKDGADRVTPVEGADLTIVGFMPHDGMPHGMNTEPVIVYQGDGVYHVDGMLFHMTGLWNVDVYVEEPNLETLDATRFNIECCDGY